MGVGSLRKTTCANQFQMQPREGGHRVGALPIVYCKLTLLKARHGQSQKYSNSAHGAMVVYSAPKQEIHSHLAIDFTGVEI